MSFLPVITAIFFVSSVMSAIFFFSAVYKNSPTRIIISTLSGSVFFALLTVYLAVPRSHLRSKIGWFEVDLRTPSLSDKILGKDQNILKARNTNTKQPNSVIISASSTQPTTTSVFNFFTGQQYVKPLYQSQDGKEFIFSAKLPPDHELKVATPPQVTVIAAPAFSNWPNR
ncbi:MAG: hypothetical protein ABSG75_18405 [Syntrophales bacterium]|jgi:hypothetical protein